MRLRERLRLALLVGPLALACHVDARDAAVMPQSIVAPPPSLAPSDGPIAVWTTARAADPELVHVHIQASAAPGALLLPWIEGITFAPCRLHVHERGVLMQDTRLSYDAAGRLTALEVVGPSAGQQAFLQRDAAGRLQRARGFAYVFEGERVVRLEQESGRVHTLRYDDDGRLVAVETELAAHNGGGLAFVYDEDRLIERRFTGPDGEHSETYFTHDNRGRLARVDVQSTDSAGIKHVHPALVLEYEGEQLVLFGYARIEYDDHGRPLSIVGDDGTRTDYDYDCPG